MAAGNLLAFLRGLTRGPVGRVPEDPTDRQLLEQFLARRDDAAFKALVLRHGPMVYRVCWGVLGHGEDAEDAFQATFLLLAQKPRTVRDRDSLAAWLHGVAHRVALKARARAATRRRHEQQAPTGPPDDLTWRELRDALDAELGRLPEKWRLPLVLCYLEGRTQDEAARHLGCGKNTLRRRLEAGRAALGRRLARRGLAISAALGATLLSDCVASAAPPPDLAYRTAEAAARVAAGAPLPASVSAKISALTEGGFRAMTTTKFAVATVIVLLLGFTAFGVVAAWSWPPAAPPRQDAVPIRQPDRPKDTKRPAVEAVGENCLVLSVTTELQRKSITAVKQPRAYVLLNGEPVLGEDSKLNATALDLDGLKKVLTARRGKDKEAGGVVFHLFCGNSNENHDPALRLLTRAFRDLGREAGFDAANLTVTYSGRPAWPDVKAAAQGEEAEEPMSGNDLVKVYPVRTGLSRALFDDADCVAEIVPPLAEGSDGTLHPEVVEALRTHVGKLQLAAKGKLLLSVMCKKGGRPALEKLQQGGAKELAVSLGFDKGEVRSGFEP